MEYTVTLTNPLASGHDGSWEQDLLMEATIPDPAEPLPPAADGNNPAPPPVIAGNDAAGAAAVAAAAGSGSGGEESAGTANNNPLPPPLDDALDDALDYAVDDVSDDDEEALEALEEGGSSERQNREGDDAGSGGAGAGLGGAGGARWGEPLPGDDGRVGGAGGTGSGGDGAGGGAGVPEDGRVGVGVEGGERVGVEDFLVSDDSLGDSAEDGGTDHEEGDEEQEGSNNTLLQQRDGEEANRGALETETTGAAGCDDEHVSNDDVSSEDEPIGRAGRGSRPQERSALPAPPPAEDCDRVSGLSVGMPTPATPPRRPNPPSSASAASSSARSPLDKYRSPDSFASQTPESLNDNDSSFDESERGSGDSSDADMDYDSDGYEVDVPFPPCSVVHKERKTFKQSLCKECFETYTRDLQRAGVKRSDVDSDSGRTINRNRTRSRRRRQPRERAAASSAGKQGMIDRRARRLRRESRGGNTSNPNSARNERRKMRSAVAASAQNGEISPQGKIPRKKKSAAGGPQEGSKGSFPRLKRRLSKEGGMQTLKSSSSEAAELDDSSDSAGVDSDEGKGNKGTGGARRDSKPRGKDKAGKAGKPRAAAKPSAVGKTVIDIAHTDSSENSSVPGAAPAPSPGPGPSRLGIKKRSSKQDLAGAAAPNSRGRGSDDFLGALMGGGRPMQRATSVDSSLPPHPGSRPKLKKRPSVDNNLQGRANTAEGSSGLPGHDRSHLKRAESLDTATSRRDGLPPSNECHSLRPEAAAAGQQDARPLRSIPELSSRPSSSEHVSTAGGGAAGAPTKKSEKRSRAELTDAARRPKPAKKARLAEKEDPPAPIPKKSSIYAKVPQFKGVVRKVSNGDYFLGEIDVLHDGQPYLYDGQPYGSAEVCAKEYEKLKRSGPGGQRGPKRNLGDSKAPSHADMRCLTQLSPCTDGSSRIAKKSLTSAYKQQGQPDTAVPARKANKSVFFAPRAEPPPAAAGPLHAPPIVQSYNVSKIDLPMRSRDKTVKGNGGGSTDKGSNQGHPALVYPTVQKICWAVTTETFRPADGLHVPGDVRVLPRRSGLVGGRRGRPAPDTRWSCAQTGVAREMSGEEPIESPEESLPGNGATKTGSSLSSAAEKNTMRPSAATANAASSAPTSTPSIPGAMPMPRTGPVTPAAPTPPPQQPVAPTAAQVNAPLSSPLTEACLSVQGPANGGGGDRGRAKLSVATPPPPNVSNGAGVFTVSGLGEKGGAAVAVGGKRGPNESAGAGAGVEVGVGAEAGAGEDRTEEQKADGTCLANGGGASTNAAAPVAPLVRLCDRLAQVRRKAEDSPQDAGSPPSQEEQQQEQEPEEEAEENRDEEDGRELLLSMMMNGGPVDDGDDDDADDGPADDEMELCSEDGADDAVVLERPYPADDVVQLSYSEDAAEQHSDATQQSAYCTQEEQDAVEEDENVDGKGETPEFEKFLADFRSSRQVPAPVGPPAAAAPFAAGIAFGHDPVPLSLSSTAATGEVNGGARGPAPTMPTLPPPPVAQVAWSTPLKISCRVNTNEAPVEDTVSPRTPWVQPRRLGGSASAGVSAAAAPCATTPLPPGEELRSPAEDVTAQSLSGAPHEMPAPSDPSLLPNGTVAKVAWRAPSRLAPVVAIGIRPAVPFNRRPERQAGGVPPGVVQLPPEVAELLSESSVKAGADGGDVALENPRAPLGAPDLLASPPPSRTPDLVVPPSSSSSSLPCDEEQDVVEERALPPSGSPKQSADEFEMLKGRVADLMRLHPRTSAGKVDAAATTTKPADESVLGDRREANGHTQSNGHVEAHAHVGRRLVVKEKQPAPSSSSSSPSSRGGRRPPALEANPRGFSHYRASSSPSRHRWRSDDSPRQSNRGSSSSSGVNRERGRHGDDDDPPRSRESPRHSTGDSSSGSSGRQRRRHDGRDDRDRPRSRDDGHHRRRYDEFGRSGSRGSSDSSGRSRREESSSCYPRDEGGRGWRGGGDYDNNRFTSRKGGFEGNLRSPRDDRRSQDSKRLRRKRSMSPQRDWRR